MSGVVSGLLLLALCAACRTKPVATADGPATLVARAEQALDALGKKDMARFATFVHPGEGARFSTSTFVRVDSDRVFTRPQVASLWNDPLEYTWGVGNGSGDPIRATYAQYHQRFVFDHDYTRAPLRVANAPVRSGNTPSNLATVYRGAEWVEFRFPGFEPRFDGMDWAGLWLVLRREGEEWFVVGVVHGSWAI